LSPVPEEDINKDTNPKYGFPGLSRPFTLGQLLPLILSFSCLCGSLGWILGRGWNYLPFFSTALQGQSATQQALMEEVRSTILAATSQASRATEDVFFFNNDEINRIHEFHDLLSKGNFEQAWCLTTQETMPWGTTYGEFINYWSEHSAKIIAPITPVKGSMDWYYVSLIWENPGSSEAHFKYRLISGLNRKCSGWLIAEVVQVP